MGRRRMCRHGAGAIDAAREIVRNQSPPRLAGQAIECQKPAPDGDLLEPENPPQSPAAQTRPRAQNARGDAAAAAQSRPGGWGLIDAAALVRLMTWLSPAYPVGAFSYSSGLEWAVEARDVTDAMALERWLAVVIGEGAGYCDATFFVHAHRAAHDKETAALLGIAELAVAFAPSRERYLETTGQGTAFLTATRAAWPCDALDDFVASWPGPCAYPVSVAVAAAGHHIAVEPALMAYLHAMTSNLISAGVRLIPLGQTQGQQVLAALEPVMTATLARALHTPLDELGSAAFRADLASQRHEGQYTRLFRS
jgi:urease accessory protein